MASFAARTAYAGPPTYRETHSRAAEYTSSAGTTRSTRPICESLGGVDEPSGEDQVLGLRRADEAGQALRATGARDDAEKDLGLPQLRVLTADPEVAAAYKPGGAPA